MDRIRKTWSEQWLYRLTQTPYRLVWLLWLIGAPSLYLLVAHFSEQHYQRQVSESMEQAQVTLNERKQRVEYDLDLVMSRFKELPNFLATHELFLATLSDPVNPELIWQANQKLYNIAHFLSVDLIMLLDTKGRCIAASNHAAAESIVGTDLSDRQYVQSALAGKLGHQYAVGRVTQVPGFYFSSPVSAHQHQAHSAQLVGAIATKLNSQS